MRHLFLINIILAALSIPAQADTLTVEAVANNVIATYGSFSQASGGSALGSDADIEAIISSDPASAIYGIDSAAYSVIDLGFGDNTVITGTGADLVVFSLWSGYNYNFGLEAYDSNNTLLSSFNYSTATHSSTYSTGVLATSIDLYDSNLLALDDNIELGYIRLFIGGSAYNGSVGGMDAYSNFSLVGAYHTQAAVVPLPLSAVLFSSGLALLGFFGRRKTI